MCRLLFIFAMAVMMCGCAPASGESSAPQKEEEKHFPIPRIPMLLSDPQDRMTYILLHYWDNINFDQRILCDKDVMLEQGFVDFLFIFGYVEQSVLPTAIRNLVHRSVVTVNRVAPLMALASKYLYHPESPLLNEEHYRIFVEEMMKCSDRVDAADQERLRMELEMMNMNRVGTPAADFSFETADGGESSLYEVGGPMTLLIFIDPACDYCHQVLAQMEKSSIVAQRIHDCQLRVLSVSVEATPESRFQWTAACPVGWINGSLSVRSTFDEVYALRALPALYLLDDEKRVLMKEVPLEWVENYLQKKSGRSDASPSLTE